MLRMTNTNGNRFSLENAFPILEEANTRYQSHADRANAIATAAATLHSVIQQEDRSADTQQDVVNAARELSRLLNDDSQTRNSMANAENWIAEHGLPVTTGGAPW